MLTIKEKFSDGTLADIVESITGAFFRTGGFESASKFLKKIQVFKKQDWNAIEKFFGKSYVAVFDRNDLRGEKFCSFESLLKKPDELIVAPELDFAELEGKLGYKFVNRGILVQAFTHASSNDKNNYERLEFLGDAVLDMIVNSNTFNMGEFSADKLTVFRHMLVNNNILAKLSISLKLYNYLTATKELYSHIQNYLNTLQWEENLLDFGVYVSDPPKILNDIFEALIGATLIDTGSLDKTCAIFAPFMKNFIVHLVKNQEVCSQNVVSRLSVHGQRTRQRFLMKTRLITEGEVVAEVWAGGKKVCESHGKSSWHAKQNAAKTALECLGQE